MFLNQFLIRIVSLSRKIKKNSIIRIKSKYFNNKKINKKIDKLRMESYKNDFLLAELLTLKIKK